MIVEEAAVADPPGKTFISLGQSQSQIKGSSQGEECVRVQGYGLHTLLAKHGFPRVDLAVIDVEGAELQVLRTFPWNTSSSATLFCEMHPNEWESLGTGPEEMENFLRAHRLRCIDAYLEEHSTFDRLEYLGPCLLLQQR